MTAQNAEDQATTEKDHGYESMIRYLVHTRTLFFYIYSLLTYDIFVA
jgi:hypothetical protein